MRDYDVKIETEGSYWFLRLDRENGSSYLRTPKVEQPRDNTSMGPWLRDLTWLPLVGWRFAPAGELWWSHVDRLVIDVPGTFVSAPHPVLLEDWR